MLSPLFVFFSTTSTTSTIPTTSGPFPQPHAILARISNSHLKASWSQNPFFYPVFSFDTFLSTKFQTPATLLIPVLLEGDDEKEYNDDDDLYIIGAVCHKSDYFAQRNFLEPSGTI